MGQSPPRREDPGLVAGAHSYVADLTAQGCLDAVFVRSFEAHGLLNAVDVSAAEGVEGVVGAYGSDQLPDLPDTPLPPNASLPPEMSWPALARGRVRYAGQPLAVVVASDRYVAEDGAELVLADIDPLDAVVDPGLASTDEVQLFEGHSNVVSVREFGSPVDEVMNAAPVVVETAIRNERLCPTSIETRGILVVPDGDGITVHVSHQAPQRLRGALARAFDMDAALESG